MCCSTPPSASAAMSAISRRSSFCGSPSPEARGEGGRGQRAPAPKARAA
jgi:hypothetical protein